MDNQIFQNVYDKILKKFYILSFHYNLKESGNQAIGFIAHELQEHYPELVTGEKDGENMQSINYIGLIPILVKEIQDLKKRIAQLERFQF